MRNVAQQKLTGYILGLELVSPQNPKRARYAIVVFVCWALVVASALAYFIFYFTYTEPVPSRLDLDITEPWYLRRTDWEAMHEYGMELLDLPVQNVIIGHSALEYCTERYECIKRVLEIQTLHHRRGWVDIGPNYLVGGNGMVFEGRGANLVGVMVKTWNRNSISVMFLGNYVNDEPTEMQFTNVEALLDELVRKEVLVPNYSIFGHCQVKSKVVPPGPKIMDKLYLLKHWIPQNTSSCIRSVRKNN